MWNKTAGAVGASGSPRGAATLGNGPGGWHPTILYLLGLVAAEIAILGFVSRNLLK